MGKCKWALGVGRVLDLTGISLCTALYFSQSPTAWKAFQLSFPHWQKNPCAWVLEAIAGSPSINPLLLQHWHMDPGSDSGTAPACQGTQGQLSEEHLCSPVLSPESPRIHPHSRTAASSELRQTSLRQSTWNTGFNWDSQLQQAEQRYNSNIVWSDVIVKYKT